MNKNCAFGGPRRGKTLIAVEAAKAAQAAGKNVLFATYDQEKTAAMLAGHGALSVAIGDFYLRPIFRTPHQSD